MLNRPAQGHFLKASLFLHEAWNTFIGRSTHHPCLYQLAAGTTWLSAAAGTKEAQNLQLAGDQPLRLEAASLLVYRTFTQTKTLRGGEEERGTCEMSGTLSEQRSKNSHLPSFPKDVKTEKLL